MSGSAKFIYITTRYRSVPELIERMHRFCDDTSLFVATRLAPAVGTEAAFEIRLSNHVAALRGSCVVREIWETTANPYRRPGMTIALRQLTPDSERVFARLIAARRMALAPTAVADRTPADPEAPVASPRTGRAGRWRHPHTIVPILRAGRSAMSVTPATPTTLYRRRPELITRPYARPSIAGAGHADPHVFAVDPRSELSDALRSLQIEHDHRTGPASRLAHRGTGRLALPLPAPRAPSVGPDSPDTDRSAVPAAPPIDDAPPARARRARAARTRWAIAMITAIAVVSVVAMACWLS